MITEANILPMPPVGGGAADAVLSADVCAFLDILADIYIEDVLKREIGAQVCDPANSGACSTK